MEKEIANKTYRDDSGKDFELSAWIKSPVMKIKPEKDEILTINSKIKILKLNFVSKIGIRNKIYFKVSGIQSSAWELFSRIG